MPNKPKLPKKPRAPRPTAKPKRPRVKNPAFAKPPRRGPDPIANFFGHVFGRLFEAAFEPEPEPGPAQGPEIRRPRSAVELECLRAGYLALAVKWHPDKPGGDAEKMRELNELKSRIGF
jgi:hypothetical protein